MWYKRLWQQAYRPKPYGQAYCAYCGNPVGKSNGTWDHVIPLSRGGSNHHTNIVPCCESCNTAKGNLTLAEFERQMTERLRGARKLLKCGAWRNSQSVLKKQLHNPPPLRDKPTTQEVGG